MREILNNPDMLRNREQLGEFFVKGEKGNDMVFDKMHFLKKESWIIEQI